MCSCHLFVSVMRHKEGNIRKIVITRKRLVRKVSEVGLKNGQKRRVKIVSDDNLESTIKHTVGDWYLSSQIAPQSFVRVPAAHHSYPLDNRVSGLSSFL